MGNILERRKSISLFKKPKASTQKRSQEPTRTAFKIARHDLEALLVFPPVKQVLFGSGLYMLNRETGHLIFHYMRSLKSMVCLPPKPCHEWLYGRDCGPVFGPMRGRHPPCAVHNATPTMGIDIPRLQKPVWGPCPRSHEPLHGLLQVFRALMITCLWRRAWVVSNCSVALHLDPCTTMSSAKISSSICRKSGCNACSSTHANPSSINCSRLNPVEP